MPGWSRAAIPAEAGKPGPGLQQQCSEQARHWAHKPWPTFARWSRGTQLTLQSEYRHLLCGMEKDMKSVQPTLVWDWKWWLQAPNPANISAMMNYSLLWVPPHHMQRTAFKAQVTISSVLNHTSLTTAFIQCSATNVQLASTRSICPCEIIPVIKTIAIILSVAAHSCGFLGHSLTALAVVAWAPQWTSPRPEPGCTPGSPCRWEDRNTCIQKPKAARAWSTC